MMNRIKMAFMTGLAITVLFLLHHCGLDIKETNVNFDWVQKGNVLTYDLAMRNLKIPNYRELEIIEDTGVRTNLVFNEKVPDIQSDPFSRQILLGAFSAVYRLTDGLHTTACYSCTSNPCLDVIDYLKVPANPTRGQIISNLVCKDHPGSYDRVLSIDSTITVPLGQFRTFVIIDTLEMTIKFWSEKNGLIRVDNYNPSLKDTVILELAKKNF
jgi:hypothetical protein